MLTLLYGPDWIANRNEILSRIGSDVQARKPGRILLVPELISHDTERLLAMGIDTPTPIAVIPQVALPRFSAFPGWPAVFPTWPAPSRWNAWITVAGWWPWPLRPVSCPAD